MRAVLYLRVSTGEQNTAYQRQILNEYAERQQWEVVGVYDDYATGTNSRRPEFQNMMNDAARGQFDIVLFWSLDRFSREGTAKTMEHLERLAAWRVKYRSFQEPMIDTSGPYGELLTGMLAAFAKLESTRIKERIHAGLARSKEQGKRPGPRPIVLNMQHLDEQATAGRSLRELARTYNTSAATIHRRLEAWRARRVECGECTKSSTDANIGNIGTSTVKRPTARKRSAPRSR
ncbi:MAG: recombinase family protein [Acidobacteria bacterium]|nr:recombinase family protein [Acidobacteriota bacterium]